MVFLYTARGAYDKAYDEDGMSWATYLEWSRLSHLEELVSLDGMLNEVLVEPDYDNEDDWNHIHIEDDSQTGFFTTMEFVFKRMKPTNKFNFLTVVLEPDQDCKNIKIDGYEFMGYDLLDQDFSISALTNCGGFDEPFLPKDLNEKGLITDFVKAYNIKKQLLENNPYEHHADTNVIAVWRHKIIGR
ncbi:hypothetical protein HZP94_10835 [Elizabethkingia anophelis]|nr:hypothetical protein [Elizabethkingia anophelis]MCT4063111.1 hypothetical protein [Elizabethkingia anophelis]MCT4109317.1 hypothetical protein [Elizabethkingia anophelis]